MSPIASIVRGHRVAGRAVSVCILMGVACTASLAAELTAQQAKTLATIDLNLKRAETDLPLVEQGLGSAATPSQSQLRLAASRLGAPKSLVSQLEPMMAGLPADDPKVQPVKQRLDAAGSRIAALEARISGTGTAAPAPTAAGARLDYRQEAELRDADYFLREVEGRTEAVAESLAKVKAATDPDAIDFQLVNDAMATIADARKRATSAGDRIAKLPANGQGVPEAAESLKRSLASLDTMEAALKPVHARLSSTVNPGSYPSLDADLARLGELAQMYANPSILQRSRGQAAELIRQSDPARTEKTRIMAAYAALLQQQTGSGKRLSSAAANFDAQLEQFTAAAQREKAALPAQIKDEIQKVTGMADQAAAEQKPAFFTGGIPDRVERIEDELMLYSVLDPAGVVALRNQVTELRTSLQARVDQLRESIIAANELPPDRYQGADRAQLEQLAAAAWKKEQPDARVLAIRIPSQNWEREVLWRYQAGGWYKIDRSKLQAQVIVQHDDKLAAIRAIDLWNDHLQGDRINAFPLHDAKSALQPQDFMLADKVE